MFRTRRQLQRQFEDMDAQLSILEERQVHEEVKWMAIEDRMHLPSGALADTDRLWWWEQMYSLMERHALTELSQLRKSGLL
ncbi:hypothetical protein [Dyella sp. C11]|uniref:hypothetical protein n=1 Tax=Dyella sp. C11 TaxID=2126991 RepID=UPI000D653EA3|nr:hypothetical protein [Dyella sp. C11]